MYFFEMHKLEAGDILLTTQEAFKSKVIRRATSSEFSHAIIYVGMGSYIHSDGDGVHSGNIQRLLLSKPEYGLALRLKNKDQDAIKKACDFARSEIGKSYSVNGAIKAKIKGIPITKTQENRQFCSRLVAQAYDHAGLKLTNDYLFCTPADILNSNIVEPIHNCVRLATPKEELFAKSDNILKIQASITNHILTETRRITGQDIQTFEQITNYLLTNPKHDNEISTTLERSGYLDIWKYDVAKNPWRYNGEIFDSLPISRTEIIKSAEFELASSEEMIERFTKLQSQYEDAHSAIGLKYFELHRDLYATLASIHTQRKNASLYVLRNA